MDGRTFLSLSEANAYKKELKQFTDIYSLGKSYADYESLKLQECIECLETIKFLDPVLNQRRNELQKKLTILKEHEESDNYKRGMQLKEEFKNKGVSNLFGYGDPGFLERAYKAAMCSQVAKAEAQPYVLMVYDKSEKESMKRIVLTESYIYNLMGLMMTGSSKIPIDAILSITVCSNIVQILLKDNKIIKWKFANGVPVDGIVKGLKKGLALKEGLPGIDAKKDLGIQTQQDESIEKNIKVKDKQRVLKQREPLEQQRNLDMSAKREREQLQKEKEELKVQQVKMKEKEQMLSKVQEELERRKVRGITYETIEEADKAREENVQIDHLKNRLLTTKSQKKRKIILGEFCCEVHTADVQNRYQQIKDKVNREIPKSIFLCRLLGMSLIAALILLFIMEIIGGMENLSVAVTAWLCIGFWVWVILKIVLIIKKFSPNHYLNIKKI